MIYTIFCMKKICPECGKEFECTHDIGCFCGNYTVSEENLKLLKEKYSDCLCEDCLKQYDVNYCKE